MSSKKDKSEASVASDGSPVTFGKWPAGATVADVMNYKVPPPAVLCGNPGPVGFAGGPLTDQEICEAWLNSRSDLRDLRNRYLSELWCNIPKPLPSVASDGSPESARRQIMHRSPYYDHGKLAGETVVFADGEVRVYADTPSESQNPAVDSTSVVCRGSDGTVLGELSLNMSDVPELVEFLCLAYGVDINAAERCVLAIRKHAAAICNCGLANVTIHEARVQDFPFPNGISRAPVQSIVPRISRCLCFDSSYCSADCNGKGDRESIDR